MNPDKLSGRLADNYLLQIAVLAAAYAAARALGMMLSLPPAMASPVWPAAGVALAALVLGGLRLWPGILLGHLAFNLLYDVYPGGPLTIFLATLPYSAGPILQAICGAWFARRSSNGLAPARDKTVFLAMLLAGPVACLIGASWATAIMMMQGNADTSSLFSNWLLWWIGDALGVVLFAPLCMLLLPAGRRMWPGRARQIALPLLGAGAILIPSIYLFHSNEASEDLKPIALRAELSYDLARERMATASNAIEATAKFFSATSAVTAPEFENFTRDMDRNGLLNIGWIPRVRNTERESFEEKMRRQGLKNYRLLQSDDSGGYEPASQRADYYPLLYSTEIEKTFRPAGFDYGSESSEAPIFARARDSGEPAASAPALSGSPARTVIFVLVPIYKHGLDPASMSLAERRESFVGIVAGAIDPQVSMSPFRSAAPAEPLSFAVTDITTTNAGQLLEVAAADPAAPSRPLWTRSFDFFGRTLQVQSWLDENYWQAGKSGKSRIFLLLTLLGAFLISVQAIAAAARDRAVSLRVAVRTRELNHNRRRLRGALNVAKIACWDLDVKNGYLTLDDHAYEILNTTAKNEGGYRLKVDDWIREFIHPEDAAAVQDALRLAAVQRPHLDNAPKEFRVITRAGDTRHLQMYFDVDTDANGVVSIVYGSSQDITNRKNMEIALRESEAYSRGILKSSSDCIMVLNLDGNLLDINQKGIELLYLDSLESVRGTDWRQFWKLDSDYAAASKAIDRARQGEPARFTGFTPSINAAPRWWDVAITPVLDAAGKPQSLLCVARDISEEHEAKEQVRRINDSLSEEVRRRSSALSASERELRAIFDVAAIGILHVSLDNRVLRVNPKMCEISGFDEATLLQQQDFARTHVEDHEREQKLVADLVNGDIDTYVLEKRYVRKDESTIWVRVTGSLVRDDNEQPMYRVSIVEDISTARAEADLREASERRYRELFDRNPTPMWTYDSESLAFTSVNEAAIQ
ncbi:MAG: PAS domain S-box protein, partial [Woeseia sp.]